jgi:hypothetical protein
MKCNQILLKKLIEMLDNPYLNDKMKTVIRGYIQDVRIVVSARYNKNPKP